MPELPDISVYIEAIAERCLGDRFDGLELKSPFLLRSFAPPPSELVGRRLTGLDRLGKRLALRFEGELWIVIHLMIAGRLQWRAAGETPYARNLQAQLRFTRGCLSLSEAGKKRRASIHIVDPRSPPGLEAHRRDGLEVMNCTLEEFKEALGKRRHTLKRSLSDPNILSGIGNAYSDEILHAARLSPVQMSDRLSEDELERLWLACYETLEAWTERLREETGDAFPSQVTAFRPEMAAHGKFNQPCPRCGAPIQRIVYASRETNYCAPCQTGGKVLADRGLSRLLGKDWPRTLEELEKRRRGG